MADGNHGGDLMSSLLPWQHCAQQLRYLKKPPSYIVIAVRKYFPTLPAIDIEEFISNEPMPTAWITSKGSTVTSEDLIQCVNTMMVELNQIADSRGMLLGIYLHMIGESKRSKIKEITDIGKEHLELFKKLDL